VADKKDSYGMTMSFERLVACMCASRASFIGKIITIDPSRLGDPAAQLAVRCALAIFKDTGHGPSSTVICAQRARRWVHEGSTTYEELNMMLDMFIEAPHEKTGEADVLGELVPVLKRAAHQEIVTSTMTEFANRGDFTKVRKKLDEVDRLGVVDTSLGTILGTEDVFSEINRSNLADRRSTGIFELDLVLQGGLPRGCLLIAVAGTSGGKSVFMNHMSAKGLRDGLFVGYATLELNVATVNARLLANLTEVPINTIMGGNHTIAREKYEEMKPNLGQFVSKWFPAKLTTMTDINAWVADAEQRMGRKMDLLAVDYGDKLASTKQADNMQSSSYAAMDTVYETMRMSSEVAQRFTITGSQAQRRKTNDRNKRIESEDIADSMAKARICDQMISMVKSDDGMITFFVAKNRFGDENMLVGPVATNFACGRIAGVY